MGMKSPLPSNIFRFINILMQIALFQKKTWNMSVERQVEESEKLCLKHFSKALISFKSKNGQVNDEHDESKFFDIVYTIFLCLELTNRARLATSPGAEVLLIGMIAGNIAISLMKRESVHLCLNYARNALTCETMLMEKTKKAYFERWWQQKLNFEKKESHTESEMLSYLETITIIGLLHIFQLEFETADSYYRIYFSEMNNLSQGKSKIVQDPRFLWAPLLSIQCKPNEALDCMMEGYNIVSDLDPDCDITSKFLICVSLYQAQVGNYADATASYEFATRKKYESGSKTFLFMQICSEIAVQIIMTTVSPETDRIVWKQRFLETGEYLIRLFSTMTFLEVSTKPLKYVIFI